MVQTLKHMVKLSIFVPSLTFGKTQVFLTAMGTNTCSCCQNKLFVTRTVNHDGLITLQMNAICCSGSLAVFRAMVQYFSVDA